MVDNDPIPCHTLPATRASKSCITRSENIRTQEHLHISYQIEKNLGLRTNKKSNSFNVATSTSMKTLVKTVLKKVKFSTRHKYAILYFDTNLKKWKKLKDTSDWKEKTNIRIRVCRYKTQQAKPADKSVAGEPQVAAENRNGSVPMAHNTQRMNHLPFNPSLAMYFYSYYCFMQMNMNRYNMQWRSS